jgi:hypothetical protein
MKTRIWIFIMFLLAGTVGGSAPLLVAAEKSFENWISEMEGMTVAAPDQLNRLYKLLESREIPGLTPDQMYAVKDEVMNALERQEPVPPKAIEVLCRIVRDAKQDEVLRDYAVQHLSSLHGRVVDPALIEGALWHGLSETSLSLAGSSLISLHRIMEKGGGQLEKLDPYILSILKETKAHPESRTAAVQLAGERRLKQAIPHLKRILNGDEAYTLKLAAIGALGQMDDASVDGLLSGASNGKDELLRPAAKKALARRLRESAK